MRAGKWLLALALAALCATFLVADDWPTQSGSPQRDGWAKAERTISQENVSSLDLLYQYQADNKPRGLFSLTSPLIDGLLITYRGFKEMLVFSGSSDNVYSVDADLNKLIWETHFKFHGKQGKFRTSTVTCPGGLTASIAMEGSSSAGISFTRKPAPANPERPNPIGGRGFGSLGAFFALSSDGYLHALNASTGGDLIPAVAFVPPNSRVSALNVFNDVVYAATAGNCGGSANAVYGIDMGSTDKKVFTIPVTGNSVAGASGTAIGSDGTVYMQVPAEQGETNAASHRTVFALDAATLGVKDFFVGPDTPALKKHLDAAAPTPIVFTWKGKDMIVAAGSDGRLYVLDSTSLGGADHHKAAIETEPIANADEQYAGNGFKMGFASWQDTAKNIRWLYASLWGSPRDRSKFPLQNGEAAGGSIVAFKLEEQKGLPVLTPSWISANIPSPASPVTANGIVFALSTGLPAREAKPKGTLYGLREIEKSSSRAVLFALDSATGKQLYTSGDALASPSYGSGLAVANGRIYFATSDNKMNAFGFKDMQPQLTDK